MSKYIIELNTDYAKSIIVFGMMGDKGVFTVFKIDELEELTSVKKAEYQRGFEDGKKAVNGKGCEGCRYECENKRRVPCILCSNNFKLPYTISSSKLKSQWMAKSDKIKVGDRVDSVCELIEDAPTIIEAEEK